MLPSGNVRWFNGPLKQIRDPPPRRELRPHPQCRWPDADGHDLQFLANGDHLVSAQVMQSHVDTSAYGGSSDATVKNAELQQVSPDGQFVWDWKSHDHISLAETGRWWPGAIDEPAALRHRPLELDRARRQLGDRLLQASRCRLQDPKEHRQDRLEARRHHDAREPRRCWETPAVHLRRPTRRPPAPRWDPDRVRQSHQSAARRRGRCDSGSTNRRERRPSCSRSPIPPSPPPTAAAPPGAWATVTG